MCVMTNYEQFTYGFVELLASLIENLTAEEGFQFPMHCVVLDRNAGFMAVRFHEETCEVLTEHLPEGGVRPPCKLLLVDGASGKAHHLTLELKNGQMAIADPPVAELNRNWGRHSGDFRPPKGTVSREDLGGCMREFLLHLVYDQGFEFPIRIVTIDDAGSLMVGRYEMDSQNINASYQRVGEYLPQRAFRSPLNLVYFDASDRGALMRLALPGMSVVQ